MATAQIVKFSSVERTSVIVLIITSSLSILSIVFLALRVCYASVRRAMQGLRGRRDSREAVFFQTQLGTYAACLLAANFMTEVAGFFGIYWLSQGGIASGSQCTTQGTLIQIGDFASAYFTTFTAVHTFQSLVLQKKYPVWLTALIIGFGWGLAVTLGTALTIISTPRHGSFFDSVGLFCAVSSGYTVEQFTVYYLPIILAALTISVLYALIFLCMRGFISIGDGIKFSLLPELQHGWAGRLQSGRQEYRHFLGAIVRSMLWYPIAYVLLFMPITIAGLMTLSGETVSDQFLAFGATCASLIGFANVLILYNILRVLRPAFSSPATSVASESFFIPEERKPSPAEEPAVESTSPTQRSVVHGRAFPSAPISRVASPSNSRPTSPSMFPVPPRYASFQDLTQGDGGDQSHAPWLRHARSNSSVGSMSSTTHLLGRHSRNPSNVSVLTDPTIVNPIVPCKELMKLAESGENMRSQNTSPAPRLGRQPTYASTALSPPPRPPRSATLRESLLNVAFSRDSKAIPPPPPVPEFTDVNLKSPEEGSYPMTAKTPQTARTPYTTQSVYDSSDARFTMYTEHDFEIQRVDSRQMVRPAVSAVAQLASPPRKLQTSHSPIRESIITGPMTANTINSSLKDDSLLQEVRDRSGTPEEGAISSIAWASLVTHAAVGTSLSSESSLRSPSELSTREDDDWEPQTTQRRPIADIPMILRPGTPGSAPSETHFRFPSTPGSSERTPVSRSVSMGSSTTTIRSSDNVRPPMPEITSSRSFTAYRPVTPNP